LLNYWHKIFDGWTSRNLTYFLKYKSNVFAIFRQFKAMVENESGQHIKVLRSDRRGEYEFHAFCDFCYHNGIQG
jgi:hypothetical protein